MAEAVAWAGTLWHATTSPPPCAAGGSWQCQLCQALEARESGDLALHSGREVQDLAEGRTGPSGERVRVPKRGRAGATRPDFAHSLARATGDTEQRGRERSRGSARTMTRAGSGCCDASSHGHPAAAALRESGRSQRAAGFRWRALGAGVPRSRAPCPREALPWGPRGALVSRRAGPHALASLPAGPTL